MNVVLIDAVNLFRTHAGFKHQPGDVSQRLAGSVQLESLLFKGQHPHLLIVFGQKFHFADRIFHHHILVDEVVEEDLEAGQFAVDRGGPELLACVFALPFCFVRAVLFCVARVVL